MKRLMRVVTLSALFLGLALGACAPQRPPLGSEQNPLVVVLVPSGEPEEIQWGSERLAELLGQKLNMKVRMNLASSFAAAVEAMGAGQAQIGWLNALSYLLANEKYGVEVILATLRFNQTYYTAQIIVRADSGIKSLADLRGKAMCWVDPLSTSGYLMPRILLKANGVDPDQDFAQVMNAGSHSDVVRAVYNGDCDAGATYVDARSAVEMDMPDVKEKVVVLATTAKIPNDNVSVVKDLPADLKEKIRQALLEIAASEEGKQALQTVYGIEGLEKVDDSFYDEFRAQLSASGYRLEDLVKPAE
ncbi:MAG: phosphate/phosphite/phosphonate ABC transporter substrate-binding protein [Thermoflexus sp.]|jgi:phosphonate transport system substrate-binding protein|nr:phosphate/phosphite/phosphonate ABC transporter substrate-binding protein [Thermoflexus sp.]